MRIVVDGRLWNESGLGRYIRNLILQLQELDNVDEYFVLHLQKDFDRINYTNPKFHKILVDVKWYGVSEQIKLPKIIKSLNPDLVHFPHFNVPIFYKGKFVVTIHDLIHQHFQTRSTTTLNPLLHTVKKAVYKKIFSHAVKKSFQIIVPSEFIKNQLISEWDVAENKISVTYEGVEETIVNLVKNVKDEDFKELAVKFEIRKPYLFYVGNAQPHKNLSNLINVFVRLKDKYPDLALVLSGPDHYFWQKLKTTTLAKHVIFTRFISDQDLVTLYKNAEMFVMPSLEEGFGIPILEAMACDCPVVSSNTASLPEVGGSAAIYFDPQNENDMAGKITKVIDNEKLRKELISRGRKRYKVFSWQKMAEQTLEIYQKS